MQAKPRTSRDTVVAGATVQRTPRVGIVLSSYKGGGDHFGNAKFDGLAEPRPPGAELTEAQVATLTRRALQLGNHPNGGFRRVIGRNESVLLLVSRYAEPVVVSTVAEMVKQDGGRVMTLAPDAESVRMPAPGVWSRRDVEYRIPRAVLECDRLISVAPLQLENGRASLTLDNYRSLARGDAGVPPEVVAMDLFGFHPAEFAVLGGTYVLRNGRKVRHNLVLAGPMPAAVDAVGAAVLNLAPDQLPVLQLAGKRGFGEPNLDLIWMLGNEIEEARPAS